MKSKNIIFSLLLIILLTVIGLFVIFKTPDEYSLRENRVLDKFKRPTIVSVTDGSFQKNFENAFSDQFICKTALFDSYTNLNNALRNTVNIFVMDNSIDNTDEINNDKDDMTLFSISDKGIFSVGKDGDWLTEFPWLWSDDYNTLIYQRIFNYNEIIKNNPNTDFYIYKVTNFRETNWFDKANEIECAGNHYEELFKNEIDPAYKYASRSYDSFEEYKKYNYKTDHHWNADGARQGYIEIIDLINDKYPEIGEPKEPIDKKTSEIKFYGSMAKTSNYNVKEGDYDLISDYIYELKDYKLYINGELVSNYGQKEAYYNNTADDDKEINHYREFFGPDTYEKIYDFGDNTGINALIIADSYSNCIEPVLASHFDKSYFYDLRQEANMPLNITKTIKEKDIDLVLYLGSYFDIFMEGAYIISEY